MNVAALLPPVVALAGFATVPYIDLDMHAETRRALQEQTAAREMFQPGAEPCHNLSNLSACLARRIGDRKAEGLMTDACVDPGKWDRSRGFPRTMVLAKDRAAWMTAWSMTVPQGATVKGVCT